MPNAFIRKLTAYGKLSETEIGLLIEASEPVRSVAAHRDLIHEGDVPGPLFVILDGWACRYKLLSDGSRQIMAFLMPGDFCDIHIGDLEAMDHSIGTITPCNITSIAHDEVQRCSIRHRPWQRPSGARN